MQQIGVLMRNTVYELDEALSARDTMAYLYSSFPAEELSLRHSAPFFVLTFWGLFVPLAQCSVYGKKYSR